MSGPRSTARWQRVRAQVLRDATDCEACGEALDFDAPPRSRWAPSVDHIEPLVLGGAAFALENLRPCHVGCNASMGAAMKASGRSAAMRRPQGSGPKPARTLSGTVVVPVCEGRACLCAWLSGRRTEDCPNFATREMRTVSVPDEAPV